MATEVIGRDEELASLEAFLDGVSAGPRALVLAGEPGIGKTILWERGVAEAARRSTRVLTCRGAEAEASLSFAGLSELLAPVLGEVVSSLVAPRRRALEVALLLAEPGDHAPDPHAIGLALLDVLHALTEAGPVMVALDDAQWLDAASAGALQLAFRRVRDEPVAMLATLRIAQESSAPFVLDRSFPEDRLTRLSLGPLSAAALHNLLKERLGLELTRPELTQVREATAGNPFFALEFGRELVRTETRPTAGRALPVPESLRELLGGRLARLPAKTTDVLLMVAALARPTVELVAAAHGDHERVLAALEAAVHEGVVALDDSRLRFEHPLVASICYEQAPIWKRRAVHRALAAVLADVEERARHLALAAEGPDEAVADELDNAAELASARGATAAAAELSELAAELTAEPDAGRRRRLRAANSHRLAGNAEQADALLEQLLDEVPPGAERADVLLPIVMRRKGDAQTLFRMFEEALAEASGDDARSARILGNRTGMYLFDCDVRAALADARAALEMAERAGDPALRVMAIARLATAEGYGAEVTPGLLERGVELERTLQAPLEYFESPSHWHARHLMRLGELERARAILDEQDTGAAARGDEGSRVMVGWTLAMLEWLAGRWEAALAQASAAAELGEQIQHRHSKTWVARVKGQIEADLGLVDEARASIEEGLSFTRTVSRFHTLVAIGVLGHLELALGNLEAAGEHLRDIPEQLLGGAVSDPTSPVLSDAIETMVGLGELERAASYLEAYEANAAKFGSPWAIAAAARCRALVAAATGDLPGALAAFARSLAEHSFPFERGRTLLCLGVVQRQAQQRKAARETLEQALGIFEELGARPWADKARAELRRISGRTAAPSELTETETRVAELAAQGRSNKEIAAELFMGVSTVEMHLSRVYRKLGIRSRTALAGRLAARARAAIAGEEAQP